MTNVIPFPVPKHIADRLPEASPLIRAHVLTDAEALALLQEQGEREAAAGVYDEPEWTCTASWCPTNGSYQCDECMRSDPTSPYYAGGEDL